MKNNDVNLDQIPFARFADLMNTKFWIRQEPGIEVSLELVSATRPPTTVPEDTPGAGPRYESFSLVFNGPLDRPLRQQTYPFEHERIGRFDLFIVPISRERGALQYQAVINRRVKQE